MSRPPNPVVPRSSLGSAVARTLLHVVFLLVAVGCLAAYEHFKAGGRSDAALASLVGAGLFGFMPLRDLSALMDVPEEKISITPVPGRGAGVMRLTIGTADAAIADPKQLWAERIAPKAMPGAVITRIRVGPPVVAAPTRPTLEKEQA